MKRSACVLVVRADGAVLAVSRSDLPVRFGFPGGGVEAGESFAQGAERELHEETGLRISEPLVFLYEAVRKKSCVRTFWAPAVYGELRSSSEGWTRWVEPAVLTSPGAAFPEYTKKVFREISSNEVLL